MTIDTETCNLALSHLGDGTLLTDPENGQSEQDIACRTFWNSALTFVLKCYDWGCHRVYQELALVEAEPNPEWAFSYRYPTDCVAPRQIVTSVRNPNDDQKVPYTIGKDADGQLIYTDMDDAILKYTEKNDDSATWDFDFKLALSYYLAFLMAPRLTAGDPFKIKRDVYASFASTIKQAQANSANQETPDPEKASSLELTRLS